MSNKLHVGLLDLADPLWTAGQTFTRLLATVLSDVPELQVSLLSSRRVADPRSKLPTILLEKYRRSCGTAERVIRNFFRKPLVGYLERAVTENHVDVILPALDLKGPLPFGVVGWIPDFQHHNSPEFFSKEESERRDIINARVAKFSKYVLCSSLDAKAAFDHSFPEHAHKSRAIPFPSTLVLSSFDALPDPDVRTKYHLPEKFLIVPNQFWAHKNHFVVLEALALLKARGKNITCAFVGLPYDSRDPQNTYLSEVLQAISQLDVRELVAVLGFVSRADLVALLRISAAVVQPSLSEGWSTSVQDALAVGRPVICSNLPVHREQAGDEALGYFEVRDAAKLAEIIESHWDALPAGPNLDRENVSLAREKQMLMQYQKSMTGLLQDAAKA